MEMLTAFFIGTAANKDILQSAGGSPTSTSLLISLRQFGVVVDDGTLFQGRCKARYTCSLRCVRLCFGILPLWRGDRHPNWPLWKDRPSSHLQMERGVEDSAYDRSGASRLPCSGWTHVRLGDQLFSNLPYTFTPGRYDHPTRSSKDHTAPSDTVPDENDVCKAGYRARLSGSRPAGCS